MDQTATTKPPERPFGRDQVSDVMTWHAPNEEQNAAYEHLQAIFEETAEAILDYCPESADRSHALRQLRDARMWANASIALQGRY